MPITTSCPFCQSSVLVPAERLGEEVACPACRKSFPAPPVPVPPVGFPDLHLGQSVRQPVPPTEPEPGPSRLSDPSEERRPCPYCGERIAVRAKRCRFCGEEFDDADERPWEDARGFIRRDCEPHRGALILILGVVALMGVAITILAPLLLPVGIAAWILGHRDLKKMDARIMDPSGRGQTQGGQICGIVATAINGLITLGCIGFAAMIAASAIQGK